jgi:hypothetical protein
MRVEIDTRNAAPGELRAVSRLFADLAGQPYAETTGCPEHYAGQSNGPGHYDEKPKGWEELSPTGEQPPHADGPGLEEPEATPDTGRKVDTKGVPFHSDFCGNAADPYYSTGKRAGQWKKRKGVTDSAYDFWYAGKLSELDEAREELEERGEDDHANEQVNTAGAFGGGQRQEQPPAASAPKDAGSFMAWVSEKQAAGLLTQEDIAGAYAAAGVQVTDLFPPNDAATVEARIFQVYSPLSEKAGA